MACRLELAWHEGLSILTPLCTVALCLDCGVQHCQCSLSAPLTPLASAGNNTLMGTLPNAWGLDGAFGKLSQLNLSTQTPGFTGLLPPRCCSQLPFDIHRPLFRAFLPA